jgi:hypothetical protein
MFISVGFFNSTVDESMSCNDDNGSPEIKKRKKVHGEGAGPFREYNPAPYWIVSGLCQIESRRSDYCSILVSESSLFKIS